jgi:hypothetical protein
MEENSGRKPIVSMASPDEDEYFGEFSNWRCTRDQLLRYLLSLDEEDNSLGFG